MSRRELGREDASERRWRERRRAGEDRAADQRERHRREGTAEEAAARDDDANDAERTTDLFCRICNDCRPSWLAAEERARALGWVEPLAAAAAAPEPADNG